MSQKGTAEMKITELKTKIPHSKRPYEKPVLVCLSSTISTEGKTHFSTGEFSSYGMVSGAVS